MRRSFLISPCESYAILQVPKNGSNTVAKCFRPLGWRYSQNLNDIKDYAKIICWIQDPLNRWIKGFVQFSIINPEVNLDELQSEIFQSLIPGIYDFHTLPISHQYMPIFDKLTFIPMDIGYEVTALTNMYFSQQGVSYKINNKQEHKANHQKQRQYNKIYNFMIKILTGSIKRSEQRSFYNLYEYDFQVYEKVSQRYTYFLENNSFWKKLYKEGLNTVDEIEIHDEEVIQTKPVLLRLRK